MMDKDPTDLTGLPRGSSLRIQSGSDAQGVQENHMQTNVTSGIGAAIGRYLGRLAQTTATLALLITA